jgi:phosphoribosylanthranilate isomerase
MKLFIKICGVTNNQDLMELIKLDVNTIGFNRDKNSPRYVSLEFLESSGKYFEGKISPVIVFVNESKEEIKKAISCFNNPILQFHGDENQEFCSSFGLPYIKAISMNESDFVDKILEFDDAFAILLDSGGKKIRGGTGKTFDWKLIPKEIKNNLIIAGGLNSNNIASLIDSYKPYGIDLASGVESKPGKKDITKLKHFLKVVNEI